MEDTQGWIPWNGGECPVEPNVLIQPQVQYADEPSPRVLFARMAWAQTWWSPNLIAYRIISEPAR